METGNSEIQKIDSNLKLIFYLDNHSFNYSIFNTINNCFEVVKKHSIKHISNNIQEIEHVIANNIELQEKYHTTLGTIDQNTATFIPDVLFDDNNIEKYIEFTSNKKQNNICYYTKQKFTDCYAVSCIQDDLMPLLKNHFHNLLLKPFGSVFVDYAMNLNQKNKDLFTQINAKNFHIALIDNNQLKFYNKFNFNNSNEFLYYFMNCIQHLSIDPEITNINIMSELNTNNILIETIKKYIKIYFINRPKAFLYKDDDINNSSHKDHNLFSQLICE